MHLTWANDPRTSIVVQWHTRAEASNEVRFRTDGGHWQEAEGRWPYPRPAGVGVWHETELTGLRPATAYEYALPGDGGLSRAYTFTTAPEGEPEFRFAAFADQGDCQSYAAACEVQQRIAADHPALVLAAGDLTYGNKNGLAAVDRWFDDVMVFAASSPVMPAWGNHEWEEGDPIENYKGRFALPEAHGEDWYSFDYAGVHFVALPELYVPVDPGGAFHAWLEEDLEAAAADPERRWTVVFGHRPFFSTGTRNGSSGRLLRHLVPVLDRHRVDLVITGHEHNYERTLPLREAAPTSNDPRRSAQGQGTIYVVTGGGGAELYDDFGPQEPWGAVREAVHQHLRVDVSGEALKVASVASGGALVDEFEIRAAPRPPP